MLFKNKYYNAYYCIILNEVFITNQYIYISLGNWFDLEMQ